MPKRKYTPEFKSEVLALCQTGDRSCAQVARDLGLSYTTLMSWVQAAKAATSGGLSVSESEDIKRLRKENERLRMERDILKNYHRWKRKSPRSLKIGGEQPTAQQGTLGTTGRGSATWLLPVRLLKNRAPLSSL